MNGLPLTLATLAALALAAPRGARAYGHHGHWGSAGAGVLLTTGTHVLLLRRSDEVTEPGTWGVPGGKVDEGEDPFTAALRELDEETDLTLDLNQVENLGHTVYHSPNGRFRYTTLVLKVPSSTRRGKLRLNWENDDHAWVTKGWLEENVDELHPGLQDTLDEAISMAFR